MATNTQNTIIKGVSILLITSGLFFVSRAILAKIRANKEDKLAEDANQALSGGSGDTSVTPSEESEAKNYNPTADVNFIYSKIAGWNYFVYPEEVNGRIMSLSDAKLKKLAEAYKKKNGGVSLFVALDDEWGDYYLPSQNRLMNLNLK